MGEKLQDALFKSVNAQSQTSLNNRKQYKHPQCSFHSQRISHSAACRIYEISQQLLQHNHKSTVQLWLKAAGYPKLQIPCFCTSRKSQVLAAGMNGPCKWGKHSLVWEKHSLVWECAFSVCGRETPAAVLKLHLRAGGFAAQAASSHGRKSAKWRSKTDIACSSLRARSGRKQKRQYPWPDYSVPKQSKSHLTLTKLWLIMSSGTAAGCREAHSTPQASWTSKVQWETAAWKWNAIKIIIAVLIVKISDESELNILVKIQERRTFIGIPLYRKH